METKNNYELIYGDLDITEVDQKVYISLKKYEEYFKIGKLLVFFIFGILMVWFFKMEIKLETDDVGSLWSKGYLIIIPALLLMRMILVYIVRYLIYLLVKKAYIKELSITDDNLNNEHTFFKFIKRIWLLLKSILFPDFVAAKFFKDKIRGLVKAYASHKHKEVEKSHGRDDSELNTTCRDTVSFDERDLCIQCNDSIKFMTKFHVKFSNWCNLMIAMVLTICIIVGVINENSQFRTWYILLISIWLLLRLISRTWEIARAFYTDVVRVDVRIFNHNGEKVYLHSWKNSYIRKPLRISLVIHSLLELIVMFTCAYILTAVIFGNQIGFQDQTKAQSPDYKTVSKIENNQSVYKIYAIKESNSSKVNDYIIERKVYEFFIYAISICFFNISYINYGFYLWNILHVWQIIMSIVLIILCIAAYLGNSDDMYHRESKFFAQTLGKVNEQKLTRIMFNKLFKKP
ncbi:TPA: hypothetical protein QCX88_004804 [Bacillus wiedmannii]|nr:hypothetical protein [Bacillus wiedmannii]